MTTFLTQISNYVLSSAQGIQLHSDFSTVDLLDQADSIYEINSVDNSSYKIDKIQISSEQLSSIKLESLSEFMRKEILQYQIGKWNNIDPSKVSINFPLVELNCTVGDNNSLCKRCISILNNNLNITLDKLTFQIEGQTRNRVYNLQDCWPVYGADLAFKPSEGLKLRELLSLSPNQDHRIVTTKELPSIPTPETFISQELVDVSIPTVGTPETTIRPEISASPLSVTSSIYADLQSLSDTELFYQPNLDKTLPLTPGKQPLPLTPHDVLRNEGRTITHLPFINKLVLVEPTILEEETNSISGLNLITSSPAASSTDSINSIASSNLSDIIIPTNRNPYAYPQNTELRNAIIDMITDLERENLGLTNQTPNNSTDHSSSEREQLGNVLTSISLNSSTNSLSPLLNQEHIENLPDLNTSKTIFDTDLSLKDSNIRTHFHYRSNSPLSPSSSSENLHSNKTVNSTTALIDDID